MQSAIITAIYALPAGKTFKRQRALIHIPASEKILPRLIEPTFPKAVKYPFITDDTAENKRVGDKSFKHPAQSGLERNFIEITSAPK